MCAFCGKIDKNFLCENCKKEMESTANVYKKIYNDKEYDEHIYMYKYENIRDKILKYKFKDKPYYYKTFANIFLNNKKMCEILKAYDIIIPVPIHNKRRKERGYNQTELIAKEIAKNINELKYLNILIKSVNTIPQSKLNKKDRAKNAQNIYKLKDIKGQDIIKKTSKECTNINKKRVLIFDDIYTTGATANECAKIIRTLKPNKIGILTIAKD